MRSLFVLSLIACATSFHAAAQAPKLPKLNDPDLRLEVFATAPDIEAPTTVAAAPDGSVYIGCDPRDTRLNTDKPECWIVRYSALGAEKKRTVFAGKLYSPAGSQWHDGWLYVIHDPLMSRFKDTDGDGVADVREDLITNLGLVPYGGLNDHVVSGFVLGMDGFFYISVGDRGIYKAKGKDGSELTMQGGGIIRCRPDGTALEIFSTGTRNHLAVLLDAEDNAFTRDNTDDGNGWWTRLTHHIEGGYYGYPYDYRSAPNYGVTQPSPQTLDAIKRHGGVAIPPLGVNSDQKIVNGESPAASAPPFTIHRSPFTFLPAMADFGGGSPTGGLCYLSDGLPEKYRGKLLFSEWGKGALHVTEVARDGATFRLVKDEPLIQSEKGADFRPMEIAVAADGSLLIADWGWGGWKAPKKLGTVWRLSWPAANPAPRLADESKASIEDLLAALGHPDRGQRLRAQGETVKRYDPEKSSVPWKPVSELARDPRTPPIQKIHAIWLAEQIAEKLKNQSRIKLAREFAYGIDESLTDASPAIRSQAVRALALLQLGTQTKVSILDADPAVRLASVLSVKRTGEIEAAGRRLSKPRRLIGRGTLPGGGVVEIIDEAVPVDQRDDTWKEAFAAAQRRDRLPEASTLRLRALNDDDRWVRFAAVEALAASEDLFALAFAMRDSNEPVSGSAWRVMARLFNEGSTSLAAESAKSPDAATRTRAVAALGRVAYQPKPYDGHWWGTQPVKNPRPLHSVPWAGTAQALGALTAALGDPDTTVRLAAAKAFAGFMLGGTRSRASQASAGGGRAEQRLAGASPSEVAAATVLRARLTAETDAAVRRQLVEALGVQKDQEAMGVFKQIALDEKADPEFRDTAIGAVVNIGGDAARDTIAQLAHAKVGVAATRKILQAAGDLKVVEAVPALIAHIIDNPDASSRELAVKALAKCGVAAQARDCLIGALGDKDEKVQTAAVEALGSLRDPAAVPALIEFAKTKRAKRELIEALAKVPDPQAIPLLLDALRDANSGIRRPAIAGLKKLRAEAWPQIEANLASGRIPAEFAPEIRAAFESGVIVKWKMIGPFENVWDAVHPPERDALAAFGPTAGVNSDRKIVNGESAAAAAPSTDHHSPITSVLTRRYHNAEGKDVSWIDVSADPNDGRVDLGRVFKNNGMVRAYAFAEIESPEAADAKLICGSDDQIAVWLNGEKVHDSGPGSRGFNSDQDQVPIRFAKGPNRLFVKIGNVGGDWQFALRIPGVDGGKFTPSKEPPPEEKQRAFALAAKPDGAWVNAGDAARGEKLFHDPNAAMGAICATCHAVRGKGGAIGPDLTAIGTNYRRPELIVSILEPAKTIALGFEQVMVETKVGETVVGALRQETADALTVVGADGASRTIAKADVKTKTDLHTSLMPPGLTLSLKPEDFVDLLAYLESLRGQ